jgi:hypothetical protein
MYKCICMLTFIDVYVCWWMWDREVDIKICYIGDVLDEDEILEGEVNIYINVCICVHVYVDICVYM